METRKAVLRDWTEEDDLALADILELRNRWDGGARTLLALGFSAAELVVDDLEPSRYVAATSPY